MTDQFSMFDHPRETPPCFKQQAGILRIIEAKAGTFRRLKGEEVTGEFRLVEMEDHSFFRVFTDGRKEPAPPLTYMAVEDGLRTGVFVEVMA